MKRFTSVLLASTLLFGGLVTFIPEKATAASASQWKAGRIIDDSLFINPDSMTVPQIQDFLNSKVGTGGYGRVAGQCDTTGLGTSEYGGGTRAQYGAAHSNPQPFTCLKDYYEVPKTSPGAGIPANNYGGKPIPAGAKSAAQLIWDAAHTHNISPKVLLVTIQKESAGPLTTDDWPFLKQYTYAMGAHCPDSGPNGSANCDPNYAGFSIQISESASLLRYYLDNMDQSWWTFKKLGVNSILYNPNTGCGRSDVNIVTKATAALYTYTPYQPNQAALNDLYGNGDLTDPAAPNCSAFGNRNFWRIYTDWFGSTLGPLVRTVESADLYYSDGERKYTVPSMNIMAEYGLTQSDVRFISQTEMNSIPIGSSPYSNSLGQVVKSSSDSDADGGSLYLISGARRIPIASMTQFDNMGFTGSMITYVSLSTLETVPRYPQNMSDFVQAPDKSVYKIENGKLRAIFELSKLAALNPSGNVSPLSDSTLSMWPYDQPLADNDFVIISPSGALRLYREGSYFKIPSLGVLDCWNLGTIKTFRVWSFSVTNGTDKGNLSCFAKDSGNNPFLMSKTSKYPLPPDHGLTLSSASDTLINRLPPATLKPVLKGASNSLAVLESGKRRFLPNMTVFTELGYSSSSILTIHEAAFAAIPKGANKLSIGTLALEPGGAISVISSATTRLQITSAEQFNHFGYNWSNLVPVAGPEQLAYASTGTLPYYFKIGTQAMMMDKGVRYLIANDVYPHYGLDINTLPSLNIELINHAPTWNLSRFIKSSSSNAVYYVENGQKRPINSWQRVVELGGQNSIVTLSKFRVDSLPSGSGI